MVLNGSDAQHTLHGYLLDGKDKILELILDFILLNFFPIYVTLVSAKKILSVALLSNDSKKTSFPSHKRV